MLAPVHEGQTVAGKYRVERVLGKGAMGVVVAARHLQLDRLVAIKFLLPEAFEDSEAVIRFEREARAAVRVQSEHVARVLDVDKLDNGAPFIVMEYLVGEDFGQVLARRGRLEVPRAVDTVVMVCEAMAEAHSVGIVHRDLKPRNLFRTRRPDGSSLLKVLDFGVYKCIVPGGRDTTEITDASAIVGSPTYSSPEQLRAPSEVDARADIWSMGIILYELIAGVPPFRASSIPPSGSVFTNAFGRVSENGRTVGGRESRRSFEASSCAARSRSSPRE